MVLLSNAGAGNGAAKTWNGGKGILVWSATVGGGNVKIQILAGDGTTWVDVASSTLSAAGTLLLELPPSQIRAVVTTSTANYLDLYPIPYGAR